MILVSGATGHVGSQVVRSLRSLDLDVVALVRKGSEYYWLNEAGCRFAFGDLCDPDSLHRALRDMRYLVVCSGVQLESQAYNHRSVTVDGHAALFQAARERGVQHTVLLSCMGASPESPVVAHAARHRAEQALAASGLDHTILRACVHEHPFLELAWRVKERGSVRLPGPGTNRLSLVPASDLGLMAAASLDLAAVRNRTVDVGGAEVVTALGAFELACRAVGVPPTGSPLPGPAVALGRRLGRPLRRFANRLAEDHSWWTTDHVVDARATADLFGIPQTPLARAFEASAEWHSWMRDGALRGEKMVHPQFYATVYEPGTARLEDLPTGPPPRRD